MIRIFTLIVCFLVVSASALAEVKSSGFYNQVRDALVLAAQVDAYNHYCTIESAMGTSIKERFYSEELTEEQVTILASEEKTAYEKAKAKLTEAAVDCKNVDFLMEKLDILKKLKASTFELREKKPSDEVPAADTKVDSL